MKAIATLAIALSLTACSQVEFGDVTRADAARALRETMRQCQTKAIVYMQNSGSDEGVNEFTMRCVVEGAK